MAMKPMTNDPVSFHDFFANGVSDFNPTSIEMNISLADSGVLEAFRECCIVELLAEHAIDGSSAVDVAAANARIKSQTALGHLLIEFRAAGGVVYEAEMYEHMTLNIAAILNAYRVWAAGEQVGLDNRFHEISIINVFLDKAFPLK